MTTPASDIRCDLVIPVYNALRSTRNCLESVKRFAPRCARVVVINDGSDARTTEWLREQTGIVLLENPVNLGFVKTANRGLLFSSAPWVCLLNSDTLLTEGALERMIAGSEKDPKIGLCCPLSNEAVNLSVKLPPGEDVFSFARRVARTSPARYPDAVTIVGFCLLVKREVIATLGVFDEVFDRGYGEETDLHYRARAAGWRCVVADDTFVYHRHGGSFTDSGERTRKNLEIVMGRWRVFHERELAAFDERNDLGAVRDSVTQEWTLPDDRPAVPFDVLFVLPMMGVFGGVATVLELANSLVLLGVKAGVVVLDEMLREIQMETFFRPLRIPSERLPERCPLTKLLVATAYQTAPYVAVTAARRPCTQTAYFVQDYEGWFGVDSPEYVARTYDLIPRMTAVSSWLSEEIAKRHGVKPVPVPISVDPDTFYPRGQRPASPVRVVAMLRPDERRGIRYLVPALAEIAKEPGVEIILFGHHPVTKDAPSFPHRHLGVLPREAVAALLATAHVVVDPSLFQGFGLVGLEGMASGAACVLTDSGGINEYAADGRNALVVPPRDEKALATAIRCLVRDAPLRARLAAGGLKTARCFTWRRTAEAYRAFMQSLPPAEPPSSQQRAAMDLLWFELCRDTAREEALRTEVQALRETLNAVSRSTLWRLAAPWHRLRAWARR
jgi:GT2 family glycosyltransferase/glycosyltransferase involved in cell wall biosynthesis